MSIQTLAVSPATDKFQVSVPATAQRIKQEAMQASSHVRYVTNPKEQEEAISRAAILKGISKECEATRQEIKRPFLEACSLIDSLSKGFVQEVQLEAMRIESLIANFQRQEREKVEAQRREEERKRQEAAAEVRREQERLAQIERDRQAAAKRELEAKSKKQREAAQAEQRRLEQERVTAEIDASEAQDTVTELANTSVTTLVPAASEGAAIRVEFDFEVTDIEAFYAWDLGRRKSIKANNGRDLPSYVKLEIKRADFKEYLKLVPSSEIDGGFIPGVRIFETTKAAVRSIPTRLSLR